MNLKGDEEGLPLVCSSLLFGNESRIYNQAVGAIPCTGHKPISLALNKFPTEGDSKSLWGQKLSASCFLYGIFRMASSWLVDACLVNFEYLNTICTVLDKKVQFDKWLLSVTINQHMAFWE